NKVAPMELHQKSIASRYIYLKDVYQANDDLVQVVSEKLAKMNRSLESLHMQVGYRVRDEICFYLAYNSNSDYFSFDQAFDYCILQKILPRISGTDMRVDRLLKDLFVMFTNKVFDESVVSNDLDTAKYPHSARKVLEMLRRLEE